MLDTSEEESTVPDFLDDKRREITDRLKELKPLVDEYNRLEAAASALAGVGGSALRAPPRARRTAPRRTRAGTPARLPDATAKAGGDESRRSTAKAAKRQSGAQTRVRPAKRRAGRRKGSGTRAAEALSFVQGQPGITIPELAAKMGIKQNYLYRVLPGLEQEKKVREARPRLVPERLAATTPARRVEPPSLSEGATSVGLPADDPIVRPRAGVGHSIGRRSPAPVSRSVPRAA